jgi:hypothetical protein
MNQPSLISPRLRMKGLPQHVFSLVAIDDKGEML